MPDRSRARELAAEFICKGDPTGWFDALYREAAAGKSEVPWADLVPNPHLVAYWKAHPLETAGKLALTLGSGLGDDAEQLDVWGFTLTAFDISETAAHSTRLRFPNSAVEYVKADLLAPPPAWRRKFDFVFEADTLQVLPQQLRRQALEHVTECVRPAGSLLVIARGRGTADPPGEMPWPMTREEFGEFTRLGLQEISFEDYFDPQEPDTRRFRIFSRRP